MSISSAVFLPTVKPIEVHNMKDIVRFNTLRNLSITLHLPKRDDSRMQLELCQVVYNIDEDDDLIEVSDKIMLMQSEDFNVVYAADDLYITKLHISFSSEVLHRDRYFQLRFV